VGRFNITVTTLITQGRQNPLLILRDTMTFGNVSEEVKDFIAGSCAATLQKFLRLPEDTSEDAFHVSYQTQVFTPAGEEIRMYTGGRKCLSGMDKAGVDQFMDWAVQELRLTVDLIKSTTTTHEAVLRKRDKWRTLFKLVFNSRN